ncbi:MAG: hypothetical protein AB8G18_19420 [Gammaproteobacteria bacterium]
MRREIHQQDLSLPIKLRGEFKVPPVPFIFLLVFSLLCVLGGLGVVVNEHLSGVAISRETKVAFLLIIPAVMCMVAAGIRYEFTGTEVIYRIWMWERKRLRVGDIKAIVIAVERRYVFLVLYGPDSKETIKIVMTEALEKAIRNAKGGAFF